MRIKAIISYIILCLLICVFSLFFLDNIVKNQIIKHGQEANGAKIEISHSKMSLSPFGIQLSGIKIANKDKPMQNLIELQKVAMHISLKSLINKKFIVENVIVTGLKTDTVRKKTGSLPKQNAKSSASQNKNVSKESDSKNTKASILGSDLKNKVADINIYDYIDKDALSINKQADKLKSDINATTQSTLKDLSQTKDLKNSMNKIKSELSKLKKLKLNSLQDITKVKDSLENIKSLENKIKSIQKEIDHKKSLVSNQSTLYTKQVNDITSASKKDYSKIIKTIDFRQFNSSSFTNTLLKGPIESQVGEYLGYYEKVMIVMNKIQSKKKEEEKNKPSTKGINVPLEDKNPLPSLWVKTVHISGVSKGHPVTILIKNISSDQAKLNKTTTLDLTIIRSKTSKILSSVEFDFRKQAHTSRILMSFNNFSITAQAVKSAKLDCKGQLSVIGSRLNGNIKITAKELKLRKNLINNAFVSTILGTIKNTSMTIFLKGQLNNPSISLTSDLDDLLNKAFKNQAKKEEEQVKQEIKAQLNKLVTEQKAVVNNALNSYKSKANDVVKSQQKQLDSVKGEIDKQKKVLESKKKEGQDKINAEKEKRQKQLDAKKKELEAQKKAAEVKLKAKAEKMRKESEAKAKQAIKKQLENQFKKLF
ncbi:hypothetical protein DID80_04090 [Candidatus Marinamargulisbacteria bacterium SCGC AAA071-K20]|nr:hypothetical protein DID80_04090 [Candidatus Marinamargulisbacteria bacterium SCGC AAA071-K20]